MESSTQEEYFREVATGTVYNMGKYMHLHYLRILTFVTWSVTSQVSTTLLAKDGFFYTGTEDEVECFSCRVRLKDWKRREYLTWKHKMHSPSCAFHTNNETSNVPFYATATVINDATSNAGKALSETEDERAKLKSATHNIMSTQEDIKNTLNPRQRLTGTHISDCDGVPLPNENLYQDNHVSLPIEQSDCPNTTVGRPRNSILTSVGNYHSDGLNYPPSWNRNSLKGGHNLFKERDRLETFKSWPTSNAILPSNLAAAGFYYTGISDRVKCVFAECSLRNWESDDEPMEEHRRHFPTCPFVLGADVGNVPCRQSGDNPSPRVSLSFEDNIEYASGGTSKNKAHSDNLESSKSSTTLWKSKPKHGSLASLSRRLDTFRLWPVQMKQTPNDLANAGFYYTGKADNVVCFQCGGGLHNFEHGDNAWEVHAYYFPNCSYVRRAKGDSFIRDIAHVYQHKKEVQEITEEKIVESQITEDEVSDRGKQAAAAEGYSGELSAQRGQLKSLQDELKILRDENEELKNEKACKICMENESNILFLPCGHIVACAFCTPALKACPVCRGKIKGLVRTFNT